MGKDMSNDKSKLGKALDFLNKALDFERTVTDLSEGTGLSLGASVASKKIYDTIFKRYSRPDYKITPGLVNYERLVQWREGEVALTSGSTELVFPGKYFPRKIFKFPSAGVSLTGYLYSASKPKALCVFVHGLHAGADDYLTHIEYLVQSGYSVFAYDGCGTFESEGNGTIGFTQWLINLDNALSFVETTSQVRASNGEIIDFPGNNSLPIVLFGHSCGGYAALSVLALHKNIKAVAAIAAPNDVANLILSKGHQYAGSLADEERTSAFIKQYQQKLFGAFLRYTAIGGINKSKRTHILLAHGEHDETISYKLQSAMYDVAAIQNRHVVTYLGQAPEDGHTSILYSIRACQYRGKVDADIKRMLSGYDPDDEDDDDTRAMRKYFTSIDHGLYSEVNGPLMREIVEMYDSVVK